MRYLLGEELVAEDAVDENGFGFIKFRAPVDSERLYVGHGCFDNRVEMVRRVMDLVKWPGSVSHVWMDRRSSFPRGNFDIYLWKRTD